MIKLRDAVIHANTFIHQHLIWLIVLSYILASIFPNPGLIIRSIHFSVPDQRLWDKSLD
jgi:hypothetical protein